MNAILTCFMLVSTLSPSEKGFHILNQMRNALKDVESVQFTMEYESTQLNKNIKVQIRAGRGPMRYWAKAEGSDGSVEFAQLEGLKMTYTDDNGVTQTRDLPVPNVVMNEASARGGYGWRSFFDPARFVNLTADDCVFVLSEEVSGRTCDMVGRIITRNDGEPKTTITYYWIDRETHLPSVFQMHTIIRGQSTLGPKYFLKDVQLNPHWESPDFPPIPEKVAKAVFVLPPLTIAARQLIPGIPCPKLTIETVDLRASFLPDLIKGRTLLTFWAPWCGPCNAELDALKELPEAREGTLKVLAVGVSDSKQNIRGFAKKRSDYPVQWLIDPDCEKSQSAFTKEFGIEGIPHAFLFGADGKLIRHWVGFSSKEELLKNLK